MSWTDEQTDKLKGLLADGLSATEIGAALGITRNAAIGKIHRLGWRLARAASAHHLPGNLLPLRPATESQGPKIRGRLPGEQRPSSMAARKRRAENARAKAPSGSPAASSRLSAPRPLGRRYPPMANSTVAARAVEPIPEPTGTTNVTLSQRRGWRCHFIAGEPVADAIMCGAATEPGSPWCPHHAARCFDVRPSRRERQWAAKATISPNDLPVI